MNKKSLFIALTTSVLIGSSTFTMPVEAGWLDKIGAIAQGIGAIRAHNQNKVDKLQENRIESYGERQYLYSERMQGKNLPARHPKELHSSSKHMIIILRFSLGMAAVNYIPVKV